METIKTISGSSEAEIWQQVTADFAANEDLLEYNAFLHQADRAIALDIDIDPGGGFESGYEFTRFTALIQKKNDFRFSIYHEGFINKVGKFFGMEDVITGYPEFDEALIVKTNDAEKVKTFFSDPTVRATFQAMTDFTLHITHHHPKDGETSDTYLELEIQVGITNVAELQNIYHAFWEVLVLIDP